jgi:hypothetical protein
VWLRADVEAGVSSDPYLFSGYDYRQLNLSHNGQQAVGFTLEVDAKGTNEWASLKTLSVPANGVVNYIFDDDEKGAWIRLKTNRDAAGVTAHFHYRNKDNRSAKNEEMFVGVATASTPAATGGLMRSLTHERLGLAAVDTQGNPVGYYEMNPHMELVPVDNHDVMSELIEAVKQPDNVYVEDTASILIVEDDKRYRFPKNTASGTPFGTPRVCREVATERDLLNIGGTFYELPARNAQGMAKIRPIATHHLSIHDFCSHAGLLFFTGIDADTQNEHVFRSADGKAAVWVGVVDDLWKLGKPRGFGGPWDQTAVTSATPSDPYLMTAYDNKRVELTSSKAATITLEVDVDGTGLWVPYKSFRLDTATPVHHIFPAGFSAYWVRAVSDTDTVATILFTYD